MPGPTEGTFTKYNATQAASYATGRAYPYPEPIYKAILEYHKSPPGSETSTLLDVGCGPGKVARDAFAYFDHFIGIDPGQGMIETARASGLVERAQAAGKSVRFDVCAAEEAEKSTGPEEVDVVTVATAV